MVGGCWSSCRFPDLPDAHLSSTRSHARVTCADDTASLPGWLQRPREYGPCINPLLPLPGPSEPLLLPGDQGNTSCIAPLERCYNQSVNSARRECFRDVRALQLC